MENAGVQGLSSPSPSMKLLKLWGPSLAWGGPGFVFTWPCVSVSGFSCSGLSLLSLSSSLPLPSHSLGQVVLG